MRKERLQFEAIDREVDIVIISQCLTLMFYDKEEELIAPKTTVESECKIFNIP